MSKKVLVALVVVALIGGGSYFVYQLFQTRQAQQAYQQSGDKIVDDLNQYLLAHDIHGAYANLFSEPLQKNYSEAYWGSNLFDKLNGSEGTPAFVSKKPVTATSSFVPNGYDPQLKQDPQRYEYDFQVRGFTYRVTTVIYRTNNQWKINELSGEYVK